MDIPVESMKSVIAMKFNEAMKFVKAGER